MNTENLSTLKIHKLTQEQYDRELAAGRIDANALYLTPADDVDLSGYATIDYVDSAIGEISTSDASGQIEEHNTDPDAHPVILEKINAIKQADWNQNDSSEKDFINNRPFYTTDPEETVIANGTIPADGMMQTHASIDSLTIGETYTAVFDGVTYSNLICENYEGLPTVMNEHFMFAIHSGNSMAYATDRSTSHTLEVMAMLSSVVPIERKYIAEHIDMIAGEKVEGRTYTVDGSQVIAGVGAEVFNDYDKNIATGKYSHAEGSTTVASGHYSHAEGVLVVASGSSSHAEGSETTASGFVSHAEGQHSEATNDSAHAEGFASKASGKYSHAEGDNSIASGLGAHAEGYSTQAIGSYSHAEGFSTIASSTKQHVQGRYNVEDANDKYAHIVGNGYSNDERSNAHTLDWQGNGWFAKDVYVGGTSQEDASKLATEYYVDNAISEINIPVDSVNGKTGAVVLSASDVGTYTTTDIDTKLNGKSDTGHNHDEDYDEYGAAADALNSAKAYTDTKTTGLASTSTVDTKINTHSTSTDAHNDIRVLITELTNKLNNFLDVDDTTSDQLSEVLTLIENNKGTLASLTISKVNVSDIINNLTTNSADKVLSAAQGVAIKGLIDALQLELDSHTHAIADVSGLQTALDGKAASSHGTHVSYSSTAPVMDGTASVGSATTVARSDHKHPTDTSRAAKSDFDSHTGNTTVHITSTERTNWNAAKTTADAALPKSGGTMTGAILYDTTGSASMSNNYISAGGGYSSNSGKYGIKLVCCDQPDCQSGLGQDLTGLNGGYELSVAGGRSAGGNGYISFAMHDVNSKDYSRLGYFDASGNFYASGGIYTAGKQVALKSDIPTTAAQVGADASGSASAVQTNLNNHISNKNNPHGVSLSQLGVTATAAQLNYCSGVTSNIQTQLNGKANSSHGTHVSYGTSTSALGTSSAGSASTVSRSDHVHALPALTSCTGTLTVAKGGTGSSNGATGLKNLFAAGATILSSHQYGSTLPSSGTAGQLFFLLAE